jgi:hypothetical protein
MFRSIIAMCPDALIITITQCIVKVHSLYARSKCYSVGDGLRGQLHVRYKHLYQNHRKLRFRSFVYDERYDFRLFINYSTGSRDDHVSRVRHCSSLGLTQ